MKSGILPYMALYLVSVFCASVSQIFLKKEAVKAHKSFLAEYLNPSVIGSYMVFAGCTILTMLAYRGLPLNYGSVLETAGYIFVTILGAVFLRERVTAKKLLSLLVIFAGIFIYAF